MPRPYFYYIDEQLGKHNGRKFVALTVSIIQMRHLLYLKNKLLPKVL